MSGRPQHSLEAQWVLVISDDAEFARDVEARWQTERHVPHFTSIGSEAWQDAAVAGCDLAIVGPVYSAALPHVLVMAASAATALALLPAVVSLQKVRIEHPGVLSLRESDDCIEVAVVVGAELLVRRACEKQWELAERRAKESQKDATLGRYMIEARHNFNNALTAVLGTVELMQFHAPQTPDEVREQVKTIQMMSLRMQGMIQRFSALESDMRFAEQQAAAPSGVLRFPSFETVRAKQ